jgi:membrane protein DedA with SNARE-associated domain
VALLLPVSPTTRAGPKGLGAMISVNELAGGYLLLGIFLTVAADQGGLPVPGYPVLIAAAAHLSLHGEALWPLLVVATAANLCADVVWFASGRKYGTRVLGLLCRVSMTPQTCVTNTRSFSDRWGSSAMIITKFIPGISAIAMALAGDSTVGWRRFLVVDVIGAVIWSGSAIVLGVTFPEEIGALLRVVGSHLLSALLAVAIVYALYRLGLRLRYRQHQAP